MEGGRGTCIEQTEAASHGTLSALGHDGTGRIAWLSEGEARASGVEPARPRRRPASWASP